MVLNKSSSFLVKPKNTPYGNSLTLLELVVLISTKVKSSFDETSSNEET